MRLTAAQRGLIPPDHHIVAYMWERNPARVTPRRLKKWRNRYARHVLRCYPRGFDEHRWAPLRSAAAIREHGPGAEVCTRCRAIFIPHPF